jgi:hypothetical protein
MPESRNAMTENMSLTEERVISLVRNALLVAGHEMGATGDHWPVIKSTIHGLMKDWEELKIERNVYAEMREHIYAQLDEMDRALLTYSEEVQAHTGPKLKELREIYDACFEAANDDANILPDEELPVHVKRTREIILTLEGDDGTADITR